MKRLSYIIIFSALLSCSETRGPMDEIELNIANKYQAEYVEISVVNEKKSINGRQVSDKSFFRVSIIESDFLNSGRKNKRFIRSHCEVMIQFLLDSTLLKTIAPYNLIEFNIQEEKGLLNKLESSDITLPFR